jgi:FKBP-type peptidyl-prolyl cis-trans isomerase
MMINRKIKISFIGVFGVLLLITASCNRSDKFEKAEQEQIDNYLASNPLLLFVHRPSGLYYLELVPGTGTAPVTNDSIFVLFTGKFLDGTIFGSNVESHAQTGKYYGFLANSGENVVGFDEAIMLMKTGGKSTIIVPSEIGYGHAGNYWIPSYQPLLFDIELVRIKPATSK